MTEFRTAPRLSAARARAPLVLGPASGTRSPTAPRSVNAARSPASRPGTTTTRRSCAEAVAGTVAVTKTPRTTIQAMQRTYGRDAGLSFRMFLTMFLLGALYVVFFVALFAVTNVGIGFLVVILGGLAFLQHFTSDKIALAASGAKIVERDEAPELHDMVERLCAMADLPKPRIAVIDTDVPNAFATGRSPKHSAVAVTRGLWDRLEPHEIEGVLAHELSHIANRDVLIMTIASFFAMVAALLVRFGMYVGMFGGGGRDTQQPVRRLADRRPGLDRDLRPQLRPDPRRSRGTASTPPTGAPRSSRVRPRT